MIDRARLETIVREAGRIALSRWPGAGHTLHSWEKEPGHPVCEADLEVDAFLKRELTRLLPSAGWLSEETIDAPERLGADGRSGGLIWLVDPIDGTRDFIRGRAGWAVSVALISAGRPLIGMLFAAARGDAGEFWFGEAGHGAWRDGVRLRASTRAAFPGSRIPIDEFPNNDAGFVLVDKPNSIALRIAMVAADEADFIATLRWGFEWDIAAAALIAREAGAAVSDAFGQPLGYNKRDPRDFGVLVCAPGIQQAALTRLAARMAAASQ